MERSRQLGMGERVSEAAIIISCGPVIDKCVNRHVRKKRKLNDYVYVSTSVCTLLCAQHVHNT